MQEFEYKSLTIEAQRLKLDKYRLKAEICVAVFLLCTAAGAILQAKGTADQADAVREGNHAQARRELFGTAIRSLGDAQSRYAGVVLLKAWYRDSNPEERKTNERVMDRVLEAHLRIWAGPHLEKTCNHDSPPYSVGASQPLPEVQAAIDVLVNRTVFEDKLSLDALDLSTARFDRVEKLFEGDNRDRTTVKRISFAHSKLVEAKFNRADLTEADFYCAHLYKGDFSGAINHTLTSFTPPAYESLNFHRATLREALFIGTALENVNFQNADLRGARLARLHIAEPDPRKTTRFWGARLYNVVESELPAIEADSKFDIDQTCFKNEDERSLFVKLKTRVGDKSYVGPERDQPKCICPKPEEFVECGRQTSATGR